MKIIGIQRAAIFSPNSVAKDEAILRAVIGELGGDIIKEECLQPAMLQSVDLILNMGRHCQTLDWLQKAEEEGAVVINSAEGVRRCRRSEVERMMRIHQIPCPPAEGTQGYWLKRADQSAQTQGDIRFCPDRQTLENALDFFRRQGIDNYVIQAHVEGDVVKFYGVGNTDFFRIFYPGDDKETKFGDETINGRPHHFAFNLAKLQQAAHQLSMLTRTPIYGGDAIITQEGYFYIIDFNDWPSFSRCLTDAAGVIAAYVRANGTPEKKCRQDATQEDELRQSYQHI